MIYDAKIGNYYKLKPRDHSTVIGKCIRFTQSSPQIPIFEFFFKDTLGKPTKGHNAFEPYTIEEIPKEHYNQLVREYKLTELGL